MKTIITILFISLLVSCSESNSPTSEEPISDTEVVVKNAPLEEVVWQLSNYTNTNGETISIVPSDGYWLGFREIYTEKIVIGFIGCHSMYGRYNIIDKILSITVEQITNENCDIASQNLNEFENFYINSFTSIVDYSIEVNTLTINSSGSSVLIFKKL